MFADPVKRKSAIIYRERPLFSERYSVGLNANGNSVCLNSAFRYNSKGTTEMSIVPARKSSSTKGQFCKVSWTCGTWRSVSVLTVSKLTHVAMKCNLLSSNGRNVKDGLSGRGRIRKPPLGLTGMHVVARIIIALLQLPLDHHLQRGGNRHSTGTAELPLSLAIPHKA